MTGWDWFELAFLFVIVQVSVTFVQGMWKAFRGPTEKDFASAVLTITRFMNKKNNIAEVKGDGLTLKAVTIYPTGHVQEVS
jgi:hypothetical protein